MPVMQGGPVYGMPQPGWGAPAQPRVAMPAPPPPNSPLNMPPPPPSGQPLASLQPPNVKPKVRAVPEDAPPPPQRLVLPTPEALGIAIRTAPDNVAVDWNQVHARLERLGIVRLQRDQLPAGGGFRVVLGLPTQQVEATGTTEAAAVLLALERAESLSR